MQELLWYRLHPCWSSLARDLIDFLENSFLQMKFDDILKTFLEGQICHASTESLLREEG